MWGNTAAVPAATVRKSRLFMLSLLLIAPGCSSVRRMLDLARAVLCRRAGQPISAHVSVLGDRGCTAAPLAPFEHGLLLSSADYPLVACCP
jgi:hypothetical protein